MKASELRMSNWVHDWIENVDFQIECFLGSEWCKNICEYDYQEFDSKIEYLKPILLTEEWLLKFGFKEYKDFGHKTGCFDYINFGFSYLIDTKKIRIMHKGNNMSHILQNEVHYVHQLQNLYFALTGEELTIKEL